MVLDAIDACHQHCREAEVGVGQGIAGAEFQAFSLGARARKRNANRRGTIALGINQVHRSLEAWHQSLVAVGGGISECKETGSVLQQPSDVPTGSLGKVGVGAFAEKQGIAASPEALVYVHAAAVIGEHGFRHEGGRLAVLTGNVAHYVFVDHHVVGCADQLGKLDTQLMLGCCHLVVLLLDRHAQAAHGEQHLRAHVLKGVVGGDREVALLQLNFVGKVATLLEAGAIPRSFN